MPPSPETPDTAARRPLAFLGAIVLACAAALAVGHRLGDHTGFAERVRGAGEVEDGVRYGREALDEDGDGIVDDAAGPHAGEAHEEAEAGAGGGAGAPGASDGAGGGSGGGRTGASGEGGAGRAGGTASGAGGGGAGASSEGAAPTSSAAAGSAPPPSTATAAQSPPEEPPATIAGRVVDPDGAGIGGASVRVLSGSRTYHNVTTGGDGAFRVEGVKAGRYRLIVRAGGYMDLAVRGTIDLAAGEARAVDDIALKRAGRIAGRVVDPEGAPVGRAQVAAERGGAFGRYETRSADDGSFELFGFPAGKSRIRATHDDFLPSAWTTVEVPRLEDGAAGSAEGVTLALKAGASIEGTITGPDGAGVSIGVGLFDARGRRVERTGSKEGAYRFEGLGGGAFQVATDALAGAIAREEVTLASGEHRRLDLVLSGGGVLTGVCQDEEGEPVRDVRVTAAAQGLSSSPSSTTGTDGRFRIEGLFDAAYVVSARPPERFAVPDPLSVAIAAAAGPQEVAFQLSSGATLAGRAISVDGGPAGGARVNVHDRTGARLAAVDADPAGRFRIPRLPASDVDIYVAAGQELGRDSRRLTAGEETTLDVLLYPAARIRGAVVNADGTPAKSATVQCVSAEGVVRRSARSGNNAQAAFEIGTLYPGRYTVTATLGGAHAGPVDVSVGPGQVVEGVVLTVR